MALELSMQEQARLEQIADSTGFDVVRLESSWWGNEKFGTWTDTVVGLVDVETEDAIHMTVAEDASPAASEGFISVADVWLPRSKIQVVRGDPEVVEPDTDDLAGEVVLGTYTRTRFGRKIRMLGDTYEAMKEVGLADEIDWDVAHQNFNGDAWVIDASEESVAHVIDVLVDAGFRVRAY